MTFLNDSVCHLPGEMSFADITGLLKTLENCQRR